MNNEKDTQNLELAVYLLTIALIVLKLTGLISWGWIWVLAPLWISAAAVVLIVLAAVIIRFIALIIKRVMRRRKRGGRR